MKADQAAASALVVLVAATESDGLTIIVDPSTDVFAGRPDPPA